LAIFAVAFASTFAALCFIFANFPALSVSDRAKLYSLPTSLQKVKEASMVIQQYTTEFMPTVILGYALIYIFVQAFSIPGSVFLSFLGGSLFGWWGVPLVCCIGTIGASTSYGLSYFFGRALLDLVAPGHLKHFGETVANHKGKIWNYILFLRLSPFFPNWFVNLASGVFSIPFHIFFFGTLFGTIPQTSLAVKAGMSLSTLNNVTDIFQWKTVAFFLILSVASLLPTLSPVKKYVARAMGIAIGDHSQPKSV